MTVDDLVIKLSEYFSIKLCKWNFVSFEKNGLCQGQLENCKYCERYGDTYLCKKKTYTPILKPSLNFV